MRDNKGQFTKGNQGKPKGATHKVTSEVRAKFKLLLDDNLSKLQDDLTKLQPKDRVKLVLELANYVLPKLKSTEMTLEDLREPENIEPIILNINENGEIENQ